MRDKMIKIGYQAIKFTQGKIPVYLALIRAGDLRDLKEKQILKADVWRKDHVEGYQRALKSRKEIVHYLHQNLGLPMNLIPPLFLNLRKKGELKIKDLKLWLSKDVNLWEIDGQHRIDGIIKALEKKDPDFTENFHIPVMITEGLDTPWEAMQFVIINSRQVKVDPQLALRALALYYYKPEYKQAVKSIFKGQVWRFNTLRVMTEMQTQSPWLGAIQPPNEPRGPYIVPEKSFVDSLKPTLAKEGGPLIEIDTAKDFLINFWKTLKRLLPEAFEISKRKKFVIQMGIGVSALHMIVNLCYYLTMYPRAHKRDLDWILNKIKAKHDLEFWQRRAREYRGPAGHKKLADEFVQDLIPTFKLREIEVVEEYGDKPLKNALSIISPRTYVDLNKENIETLCKKRRGAYVLLSLNGNLFYVGRDDVDVRKRLLEHHRKGNYHLFNVYPTGEVKQNYLIECALWHLLPPESRPENKYLPAKPEEIKIEDPYR